MSICRGAGAMLSLVPHHSGLGLVAGSSLYYVNLASSVLFSAASGEDSGHAAGSVRATLARGWSGACGCVMGRTQFAACCQVARSGGPGRL
jgi:hypothetical protein